MLKKISMNKRMIKGLLFCISLIMVGCSKTPQSPNVIIFFTDDQGYQDVGCFGSPLIKTPHLDQMAQDGVRFTDFYSASSVCSPSRAALLTGCYPPRVGVPRVLWPNIPEGMDQKEVTIAEVLKQKGYATACIGKWHLGDEPEFLPINQGFDQYFGIPFSNDMSVNPNSKVSDNIIFNEGMTLDSLREKKWRGKRVPLMVQDEVVEYPVDQTYLTKRYTEQAIKFIKEKKDSPFFLYLAQTMPHVPLYPSPDFKGKSERGIYGDVIQELDWSMGEILKTLKELGLEENTLVVFTSDNGPWKLDNGNGGSALPLRGHKFQTYEGGMREPMIAQWKGQIPAGTVCTEVASTIDLLPTLAKLTGAQLPETTLDGNDIWPLLSGQKGAKSPHEAFYFYKDTVLEAVRCDDWKLRIVDQQVELFNLKTDISESQNIAQQEPEVVERLKKMMVAYDTNLKNNLH